MNKLVLRVTVILCCFIYIVMVSSITNALSSNVHSVKKGQDHHHSCNLSIMLKLVFILYYLLILIMDPAYFFLLI